MYDGERCQELAIARQIDQATRSRATAEITFADGEIVIATEIDPPFEDNGSLVIGYRLERTNRAEKYAAFGHPARSFYIVKVAEISAFRVLSSS